MNKLLVTVTASLLATSLVSTAFAAESEKVGKSGRARGQERVENQTTADKVSESASGEKITLRSGKEISAEGVKDKERVIELAEAMGKGAYNGRQLQDIIDITFKTGNAEAARLLIEGLKSKDPKQRVAAQKAMLTAVKIINKTKAGTDINKLNEDLAVLSAGIQGAGKAIAETSVVNGKNVELSLDGIIDMLNEYLKAGDAKSAIRKAAQRVGMSEEQFLEMLEKVCKV